MDKEKKSPQQYHQLRLDREKWFQSIMKSCDLSGSMYYCDGCKYAVESHCSVTQEQRVSGNLCAKNAMRLVKAKKKGAK
nr:MAG TPA: hypothetical protein [Caudoviricetes sp.]